MPAETETYTTRAVRVNLASKVVARQLNSELKLAYKAPPSWDSVADSGDNSL